VLIGRFLEHSRVYYFGNGGDPEYFIGSADLMKRNLDERIEVLTPIRQPALQARLDEFLQLLLAERRQTWELRDRSWSRLSTTNEPGIHEGLMTAGSGGDALPPLDRLPSAMICDAQ